LKQLHLIQSRHDALFSTASRGVGSISCVVGDSSTRDSLGRSRHSAIMSTNRSDGEGAHYVLM